MTQGESLGQVLVVDDEEDLCLLLSLRLEHHGYSVTTETTYRGALELLSRELFDAVVLDLRLDDGDGLELLERIKETNPDLPVVMLTAHGSIEAAVQAMERGAYGFLTKPFHDHELLQKLAHALEGAHLRRELAGFRRMVGDPSSDERLLGTSAAIAETRELIARVAPSEAAVLITGEPGTGKDLAARSLHALSPRRGRAFVRVSCAATPADLLERQLFGDVRGALPGAHEGQRGLLAAAEGGTLFLDEVGAAPPSVQQKLFHALRDGRWMPLGATRELEVDVRVVASTSLDLAAERTTGRFREDLFYRLHVVPVRMPALRERAEDIPLLAELFLRRAAVQLGLERCHLLPEASRILSRHAWPGNVRELANVIQGAALLARDGRVGPHAVSVVLPSLPAPEPEGPASGERTAPTLGTLALEDTSGRLVPMREARELFDRAYLSEVLHRERGNVSAAARAAGRNRTDFHDLLRRHGIDADTFRE